MNQAPAPRGNMMDSDSARQGGRFCSPDEGTHCLSIKGDVTEEVMLRDRSIGPCRDGA